MSLDENAIAVTKAADAPLTAVAWELLPKSQIWTAPQLNLFPPHSRGMARFMALAEALLRQVKDLQDAAASIGAAFSFGEAVGVQLDAIGASVGVVRGRR